MKTRLVYKIRRIKDGLYSAGGSSPKFTKEGKTWSNIGFLKSHLAMIFLEYSRNNLNTYDGCEIEVYEVREPVKLEYTPGKQSSAMFPSLSELVEGYKQLRKEKDVQYEAWLRGR